MLVNSEFLFYLRRVKTVTYKVFINLTRKKEQKTVDARKKCTFIQHSTAAYFRYRIPKTWFVVKSNPTY